MSIVKIFQPTQQHKTVIQLLCCYQKCILEIIKLISFRF